ncbi:uncharacterized protein LOC115419982 isoform X2 [Sphaeramia orbicularis]|uniref:uncharacterized protein LOC115419978 isoform X2 n=1 Tax=Sphaeramia orbicularis TaxID=375764 RepID=UPI00117D630B|nr:uncharacterized protein LOC115419978 isoform X2 [Sphaeramia orbicularis]XP_029990923.1 uncharacterized protein LOC115419979 isoform X2 [Sphaeramia orbicularis]XP_029990929.1 uncharacterized protein LOC115419980 isoform X2 [Sphaeramia orbicularis]XP_029990935.1 uncharacterized protein LOC115419982 isoform X2 [Sphaeramia orbicularis]
MAGHLLILILTYLAFEVKGQVLRAPKLLVDPPVITEKATVTLNCQTPSPVSECFYIIGGKPAKQFSCLKKLTGTELLSIVEQSPPTEIKVKCFYLQTSASPHSDSFSITIQPLFPPTLIIDPPVIAETDSVTLNCQTPSSVSVSRCYFYTLSGRILGDSSCVQTLKGAELMVNKHLPAEVKLKCYYTVNHGEADSPSPHSAFTSVTVQSQKPHITVHRDESFVIVCSLPGSVKDDTRCNLYFGESTRPQITATTWGRKTSNKQRICQFFIPVNELLRYLDVVQKKDVSCDYSLSDSSVSPRSDGFSLTDIVNTESNKKPGLTMTPVTDFTNIPTSDASPLNPTSEYNTTEIMTDPTISLTSAAPPYPTSEHKPTETWMWNLLVVVGVCEGSVGVVLLGLMALFAQKCIGQGAASLMNANMTVDMCQVTTLEWLIMMKFTVLSPMNQRLLVRITNTIRITPEEGAHQSRPTVCRTETSNPITVSCFYFAKKKTVCTCCHLYVN